MSQGRRAIFGVTLLTVGNQANFDRALYRSGKTPKCQSCVETVNQSG